MQSDTGAASGSARISRLFRRLCDFTHMTTRAAAAWCGFALDSPPARRIFDPGAQIEPVLAMALANPRFSSNRELAAAANNKPSLKRGAKGEGVAILQQALLDLGFALPVSTRARSGLPDGVYGAETETAVRAFQRKNRLQQDGVAGRETLPRLETAIRVLSQAEETRFKAEFVGASRSGGLFA